MKKTDQNKFTINTILYFISMVVPKIVGFVMLPIYTRYIPPEELGIFSYTTAMIGVIAVFSSLGLHVFYLRNYSAEEDKKIINGSIFWFLVVWNMLLFVLGCIFLPIMMGGLSSPFPFYPYMFIALATQFFHSMEIIPLRTFRIRGEVKYYLSRNLSKILSSVLLNVFFVVFLKYGIIGRYVADFISSILFATVFINYMRRNSYFRIDRNLVKRGIRFSLPIVISDILHKIGPLAVNIITQKVLSLSLLGIYSIAVTLSHVVQLVTNSIFLSIEPVLYKRMYKPGFQDFFINVKRVLIPITAFVCVGSGLFVRELTILLLAEKYWGAWPIVQVISISYLLKVLNNLFSNLAIVQKRTRALTYANLMYVFSSIIVSLIALPIWGFRALGWSEIFGIFTSFIVLYIFVDKSVFKSLYLKYDFLIIVLSLATLFASRIVHQYSIMTSLLIKFLILIIFFILELLLMRITPKQFIRIVIKSDWSSLVK